MIKACTRCGKKHGDTGARGRTIIVQQRGKRIGLCRSCVNSAIRAERAAKHPPCAKCGNQTNANGNPLHLHMSGEYAGWCDNCKRRHEREQVPCKDCGARMADNPSVKVFLTGENAGLCKECVAARRAVHQPNYDPHAAASMRYFLKHLRRNRPPVASAAEDKERRRKAAVAVLKMRREGAADGQIQI